MFSEFAPPQAEVTPTTKIFEKPGSGKLRILTGDVAVNGMYLVAGNSLPACWVTRVWAMAGKDSVFSLGRASQLLYI